MSVAEELMQAAAEMRSQLAARYGIPNEGEAHKVWAAIHAAQEREAAEYRLPAGPTTIVWGVNVHPIARERGVPAALIRPFTGGYDDWAGSCEWVEVPGVVNGPQRRFSPDPGRWMTGVRI